MEKALHFGNGSLKKSDRETIGAIRVKALADYFNVSMEYLMTGVDTDTTSPFTAYQQDSEFMSYIHRLWSLPESYKQDIYKQIRYAEMGYWTRNFL